MHAYLLRQGAPGIVKPLKTATNRRRSIYALVAVLAAAAVAAGGYAWHAGFAPRLLGASVADDRLKTAPRLSIVVLPFENLSGDKEQEYFAEGITDDLTTDLSHLKGSSFVASSAAVFSKAAIKKGVGLRAAHAAPSSDSTLWRLRIWHGDSVCRNRDRVPEPSTWALLLAGFAGLGFVTVRRARKTAVA